jgi:hypothetical protein
MIRPMYKKIPFDELKYKKIDHNQLSNKNNMPTKIGHGLVAPVEDPDTRYMPFVLLFIGTFSI